MPNPVSMIQSGWGVCPASVSALVAPASRPVAVELNSGPGDDGDVGVAEVEQVAGGEVAAEFVVADR